MGDQNMIGCDEYRALVAGMGKKRKYRNVPTAGADGRTYDSRTEARRAADLKLLRDVGELVCVVPQPRVLLGDLVYVADFLVMDNVGTVWFEDVKGVQTPRFRQVRRLWRKYMHVPLVVLRWTRGAWSREAIEGR